MSKNNHEILNKNEENKHQQDNQKYTLIKKNIQNSSNQNDKSAKLNNNQKSLNINTQNHAFFDNKLINDEEHQKNISDINTNNYKMNQENTKRKPPALRLGSPAAHPSNAYCCFRQDLTGFTSMNRTGPNLHRTCGKG